MLIVDAHEDIAFNALNYGRDCLRSALATRQLEIGTETPGRNGHCMLGLPEWILGRTAVIFSTLFAAPKRRSSGGETEVYADAAEAHLVYSRELDYYHRLTDENQQFALIGSRGDLEAVLRSWDDPLNIAGRRIGLVPLMEGADGIRAPAEAEEWMERGVRIVSLSWAGTRYAGGTGEPGPVTPDGHALLEVMADVGLMLDLSHASEESYFQALDHFPGTVLASHSNPRALCEPRVPDRNLTDTQIRRLAERGGVMGVVFYNAFLKSGWKRSDGKAAVTLETVAATIDHICQVTGSAEHVGLGSDFDGGFGAEGTPAEIDTVADLMLVEGALARRGYGPAEIEAVLGGNWLALLRRGLPA
jgi:membrane dipeptidase